jgi:hypothetical protein
VHMVSLTVGCELQESTGLVRRPIAQGCIHWYIYELCTIAHARGRCHFFHECSGFPASDLRRSIAQGCSESSMR